MESQSSKLSQIRSLLADHTLTAYLVFHNDAHTSEYLAKCDERVHFISGFSGSSGLCVITNDKALMWTDGRYYLQAERQLEEGWQMMKMEAGFPTYFEWLSQNLPAGSSIGVDPSQISAASFKLRSTYFKEKSITLKAIQENLVDKVWAAEKPAMPQEPVFVHEVQYAGLTVQEKYSKVASKLEAKKVDALLVTTLDDIDWLVNLRGKDIAYNPVFFAYAIFYPSELKTQLFISKSKIANVQEHLSQKNIEVREYNEVSAVLSELTKAGKKIGYDENSCNAQLFEAFKDSGVHTGENVIQHIKSIKNPVEMEGMRRVNIKNCASLIQYFAWMENNLKNNPDHDFTEYTAAQKLEEFRKTRELYQGPSFDTISSMGPNGAVIHYKPEKDTALKMNNKEIYLLDSGVQYLDGTTDITRTVHFGGCEATDEQKDRYTRVLLGVLDLERIVWPSNGPYCGADFDTLARRHLWEDGVDYKHGTGHGVGSFNCVHEGPQGISRRNMSKLEIGMCVSNEPGYYKDGEYGIRIENVIMVNQHPTYADRLYFENLTFCPYSRELIDLKLLSPKDRAYLNQFNKRCVELLTPLLEGDELSQAYLYRQCASL
ncbi:hypothetical protein FGO68_gene9209 [Halteria grandinella]|uniref:Xaa-Pro aminopeptidase n=1 Tax=Halteria grandinella TaxID=5974 RepID=A0A8J8T3E6_HALGN|nr:hypothetical protein FGO68_gene9209 [Halteria grandinella]